jgi:hypothetical protein
VDGIHGPAAGTAGFDKAPPGLYQVPWQEDMAAYGNNGGHMDSCEARFVQAYVARWVLSPSWPGR